jgi:hypothetical protein
MALQLKASQVAPIDCDIAEPSATKLDSSRDAWGTDPRDHASATHQQTPALSKSSSGPISSPRHLHRNTFQVNDHKSERTFQPRGFNVGTRLQTTAATSHVESCLATGAKGKSAAFNIVAEEMRRVALSEQQLQFASFRHDVAISTCCCFEKTITEHRTVMMHDDPESPWHAHTSPTHRQHTRLRRQSVGNAGSHSLLHVENSSGLICANAKRVSRKRLRWWWRKSRPFQELLEIHIPLKHRPDNEKPRVVQVVGISRNDLDASIKNEAALTHGKCAAEELYAVKFFVSKPVRGSGGRVQDTRVMGYLRVLYRRAFEGGGGGGGGVQKVVQVQDADHKVLYEFVKSAQPQGQHGMATKHDYTLSSGENGQVVCGSFTETGHPGYKFSTLGLLVHMLVFPRMPVLGDRDLILIASACAFICWKN